MYANFKKMFQKNRRDNEIYPPPFIDNLLLINILQKRYPLPWKMGGDTFSCLGRAMFN